MSMVLRMSSSFLCWGKKKQSLRADKLLNGYLKAE